MAAPPQHPCGNPVLRTQLSSPGHRHVAALPHLPLLPGPARGDENPAGRASTRATCCGGDKCRQGKRVLGYEPRQPRGVEGGGGSGCNFRGGGEEGGGHGDASVCSGRLVRSGVCTYAAAPGGIEGGCALGGCGGGRVQGRQPCSLSLQYTGIAKGTQLPTNCTLTIRKHNFVCVHVCRG